MSATMTARTMTTHDVISWRFWPSICSQQNAIVSPADADGKSESSATGASLCIDPGRAIGGTPHRPVGRIDGLKSAAGDISDAGNWGR